MLLQIKRSASKFEFQPLSNDAQKSNLLNYKCMVNKMRRKCFHTGIFFFDVSEYTINVQYVELGQETVIRYKFNRQINSTNKEIVIS